MTEGSFKGIVIGFILISLFIFTILTFAIEVANDYGRDSSEITGGTVDLDEIEDFLEGVEGSASNRRTNFEEKEPFSIGGSDVLLGIWNVVKGLWAMITTPFTLVAQIVNNILFKGSAIGTLVTSVILGILIIIIIFAIWKVWKTGY
jgi:hypothetical protein